MHHIVEIPLVNDVEQVLLVHDVRTFRLDRVHKLAARLSNVTRGEFEIRIARNTCTSIRLCDHLYCLEYILLIFTYIHEAAQHETLPFFKYPPASVAN